MEAITVAQNNVDLDVLRQVHNRGGLVDVEATLASIEAMPPVSADEALRAVEAIRLHARANGMSDMSMEEIDAIIAECRKKWREREG